MASKLTKYYENKAVRHYTRVVAFAVVGIVFGAFLVAEIQERKALVLDEVIETATTTEDVDAYTLRRASPRHIRIPAVGIDAPFAAPLGVNEDQTIQVPETYDQVGWYKHGPTPGELGPAVILGHVDSITGPAVFFPLGQLEEGDEIFIDRIDGSTATFTVERLERHEQSGFPTEKVYGNLDYAGLRLITCTGIYSHGSLRYSHNLIVFARLEEPAGE